MWVAHVLKNQIYFKVFYVGLLRITVQVETVGSPQRVKLRVHLSRLHGFTGAIIPEQYYCTPRGLLLLSENF